MTFKQQLNDDKLDEELNHLLSVLLLLFVWFWLEIVSWFGDVNDGIIFFNLFLLLFFLLLVVLCCTGYIVAGMNEVHIGYILPECSAQYFDRKQMYIQL